MKSDWEWRRLGDSCTKIGSGATPTGGKETYSNEGQFCLIRSQNVYNEGFSINGLAFITEEQASKLNNVVVEKDDVLLNITGDSVARVCLAPIKYLPARVNQHVAIIRPNKNVFDSRFVRYFLATDYQQNLMLGFASAGATRNALTKSMIENFTVPCPPISIQHYIADFLSAIDDRIVLLRETNTTLESIAQTLFKSWFVDFDPVHAKAEGRQPEGIDMETAALFPNIFQVSELGLIPSGWRVSCVSDFAKITKGTVNPQLSLEIIFEHYSLPAFDNHQEPVYEKGSFIKSNKTPLPPDAVLLSKLNPHTPRIWLPTIYGSNSVCSTEFLAFSPIKSSSKEFIYNFFCSPHFLQKICQMVTGTSNSHQRVRPDQINTMKTIIPSDALIKQFTNIVRPIFEKIYSNRTQIRSLKSIRDALLPRLISGQLQLPDELLAEQGK